MFLAVGFIDPAVLAPPTPAVLDAIVELGRHHGVHAGGLRNQALQYSADFKPANQHGAALVGPLNFFKGLAEADPAN